MSHTRDLPCQLALDFDSVPAARSAAGLRIVVSNVVQVSFGIHQDIRRDQRSNDKKDHDMLVKQVLLNAKMLRW